MAPPNPSVTLEPPGPGPTTDSPRPTRRSWRQRVVLGAGIVVVLAIVAGIAAAGYGWWRVSQINRQKLSLAKAGANEPQNFLVVGSDSRDVIDKNDPNAKAFVGGSEPTGGKRSDTIMVMRLDPKAGTADVISFPRDLWVPIAGTGENQRINTAYSETDGAQKLIDTIQQDFGIPINHYVEINFKGFQSVVNAIGGVPMYFDKPMRDTNSGLSVDKAGCVTLDGENALAFARSRHLEYYEKGRWHSDGTADLGRINRQQFFMRKVIDRSAAKATSLDLAGTNALLSAGVKNLTVDKGFSIGTMLTLVKQFKAFRGDEMTSHVVPTSPFTTAGGAAVLRLDDAAAQPVFDLFRGKAAATKLQPSDVTVVVRNAGGVTGAGSRAQAALQSLGFTAPSTDNSDTPATRTEVHYGTDGQDQAKLVAAHVKGGADVSQDPSLASGQVMLVIGKDFGGIVDDAGAVVGSKPTSSGTKATTSTTAPVTTQSVGVAPGQAPDGVTCS